MADDQGWLNQFPEVSASASPVPTAPASMPEPSGIVPTWDNDAPLEGSVSQGDIPANIHSEAYKAADDKWRAALDADEHIYDKFGADSTQRQVTKSAVAQAYAEREHAREMAIANPVPKSNAAPDAKAPDDLSWLDQFPEADAGPKTGLGEIGLGARGAMEGIASLPDLIAGGLNGVVNSVTGSKLGGHPFQELASGAADAMGLPVAVSDSDRLANAGVRGAAAGLATAGAGGLISKLPGAAAVIGSALADSPIAQTAAGGASAASSELARQHGASPLMQLGAGLAGGVAAPLAGGAAARVSDLASSTLGGGERQLSPLAQAFKDQDVPALPADVGGVGTQMATGAIKSTLGGTAIHRAAQQSIEAAQAARDRIAGMIGNVTDTTGAGQAVKRGTQAWMNSTHAKASGLYEAIPINPKLNATADATRAALARNTTGFESNPELSPIWTGNERLRKSLEALTPRDVAAEGRAELEAAVPRVYETQAALSDASRNLSNARDEAQAIARQVPTAGTKERAAANVEQAQATFEKAAAQHDAAQAAIDQAKTKIATPPEGGKISWEDIKRLRSIVGDIVGGPSLMTEGPQKNAMKDLYGALSDDMRATAAADGQKSLAAFNRANAYFRARQNRIAETVAPILGKDGANTPDEAFKAIQSWAGSNADFTRISQALRTMPKDEADTVRATMFSRLGNAPAGKQGADGETFSPSTFLTQWNKLTPRARNVLFPGEQYQKDIRDILQISNAQKNAQAFSNTSHTATATTVGNTLNLGLGAAGGLAHGYPGAFGAFAAGQALQLGAGKLLASPRFARWLASTPKMVSPSAQLTHINKLVPIALAQPAIANDILGLQERLAQAFAQAPTKAAAQDATSGDPQKSTR